MRLFPLLSLSSKPSLIWLPSFNWNFSPKIPVMSFLAKSHVLLSILILLHFTSFLSVDHLFLQHFICSLVFHDPFSWFSFYQSEYTLLFTFTGSSNNPLIIGVSQSSVLDLFLFSLSTLSLGDLIGSQGLNYLCAAGLSQFEVHSSARSVSKHVWKWARL